MVQADPQAIFLKHFFEMRKYVKCRTCESFEARNQNESSRYIPDIINLCAFRQDVVMA